MAISEEDIRILKLVHGCSRLGYTPPTDIEWFPDVERLERAGYVIKNDDGVYLVTDDIRWKLVDQGVVLEPR